MALVVRRMRLPGQLFNLGGIYLGIYIVHLFGDSTSLRVCWFHGGNGETFRVYNGAGSSVDA